MLLSPRKNGLTSLFKEVRVFKVLNYYPIIDTEYDLTKVPPYNGNDPRPPLVV